MPESLFGGGESSSPPKKKRKTRGTGAGIGRRQKSSRITSTEKKVEDCQGPDQSQLDLDEVAGPSSPTNRSDKRSEWKNSPKGKESIAKSRKKYESSEKASITRRRYKSSQERLESRKRYDVSQSGLERRSRYDSSQQGAERKVKYECSPGGEETRRRYKSAEGRLVRAEYRRSEGGITARRKAAEKYKGSEIGREAQSKARRRYELKESAFQRRQRYNAMRAYNRRVKKAIHHLVKRAAENRLPENFPVDRDSEHEFPHELLGEQSDEPEQPEPGVEESLSNKRAMSAIRSYKVSFRCCGNNFLDLAIV